MKRFSGLLVVVVLMLVSVGCDETIFRFPRIVEQNYMEAAYDGECVEFYVVVEGEPPFEYQWRADGVDIPFETNKTLIRIAHWGRGRVEYTCRVTNCYGEDVSDPAIIRVLQDVEPPEKF